jgi:CheY-like chemotaxis protein
VRCQLDETQPAKDAEDVVMLRFSVQDTGIGMTQEGCDSLFRPFQQLESGTTRRFGGTGLGLSISRQIVTLMGGAIGVTSELGKGSTFWFTIPAQRFVAPEAERHATEMRELRTRLGRAGPPRVLAISASPTTHSLLTHLLSGFAVTCVPGLAAGLEFVRVRPPALEFVLLDDQSDAHAAELAEALRTAGHTASVVHLYTPTTGLGAGHVAGGGSAAASVARLTKPPRQARLLHTLARLKNVDTAPAPAPGNSSGATEEAAPRTLYGEVLIAEDNAVAQRLLVKQLERVGLKVTATSNGQEAIDRACGALAALCGWGLMRAQNGRRIRLASSRSRYSTIVRRPTHFPTLGTDGATLPDMPICDGVEAARRIRQAEEQRAVHTSLPSTSALRARPYGRC